VKRALSRLLRPTQFLPDLGGGCQETVVCAAGSSCLAREARSWRCWRRGESTVLADLELKPGFRRFAGKSGIAEGRSDLRECRESTVMSDSALKLRLRLRLLLKFRRYSRSRRCSVVKRLTGAMLLVRRYCDAAVLRTAVWRKRHFGAAEKLVRRNGLKRVLRCGGNCGVAESVLRLLRNFGTSELRCCSAIAALASGPHPCSFSRSLCESRPAADGSAICGHQSRRLRWRRRFRAADFGAASVSGGSWRKRGAQTIMGGGVGGAGWRRSAGRDPGRPKLAIGGGGTKLAEPAELLWGRLLWGSLLLGASPERGRDLAENGCWAWAGAAAAGDGGKLADLGELLLRELHRIGGVTEYRRGIQAQLTMSVCGLGGSLRCARWTRRGAVWAQSLELLWGKARRARPGWVFCRQPLRSSRSGGPNGAEKLNGGGGFGGGGPGNAGRKAAAALSKNNNYGWDFLDGLDELQ
jgi:hypothetical protein